MAIAHFTSATIVPTTLSSEHDGEPRAIKPRVYHGHHFDVADIRTYLKIVEIGPTTNWVKVQVDLVAVYEAKVTDDVVWQQAQRLGHYVC